MKEIKFFIICREANFTNIFSMLDTQSLHLITTKQMYQLIVILK